MLKILEAPIKAASGYVEVKLFENERAGYCCGTCIYMQSTGGKNGNCGLHLYSLKTYGCCNQWKLGHRNSLLGYDGRSLRVIR